MSILGCTKSGFMLCIGICLVLVALNNISQPEERTSILSEIKECGYYPGELCKALFEGKSAALVVANVCQEALTPSKKPAPNILEPKTNCSTLIKELHLITKPLSEEEAGYPLAFIMTIHKNLEMFLKLLTAIYAPQNIYCIHIDQKSPNAFSQAVQRVAHCLPNIFISAKQETVVYAGISRLQADLNCMEDLVRSDAPWSHVINLCGQDFPIRTNREIIRYLKSKWNRKNLTPGVIQPDHMKYRTQVSYKEFVHKGTSYVYPTKEEKGGPPYNITLYFGTAYYALTRDFVQFVLTDEQAKDLLEWSKDTYSPDEHYWVTLNRIQGAPGSTPEAGWEGNIRAIKWRDQEGKSHSGCNGHYVRDICVYGLGDLQWLTDSPHLYANKFDPHRYPLVTDCLERQFRQKVLNGAEVPIEQDWYFPDEYTLKTDL
ncbi:PREDICTED: beta-1,3-galactosyl-O-glycosyl-glycoprotein beta-1,6-N-acetylglucosaminyltransferase 7 [Nanorana parkeri]|uniref:beta-1,3-galactosyl-O-glycosyl-glycoprotein beta-1,6-N-acetylglucosaminyltransferase 7 n=1 Tax=Nanorana parkeri TaxID=125878 RepID=UPI0008542724|nr:PREDICTED: beta-1,3-galactosyl-O-glycosyl-glycoprotein beta-1,6-N-acetylglucosaminyltransferase 7 [Nanorana parkeri]